MIALKDEMKDIMKIVKFLGESSLLIKGTGSKRTKSWISGHDFGANLLGNLLTGKGATAMSQRQGGTREYKGVIAISRRRGQGTIRVIQDF